MCVLLACVTLMMMMTSIRLTLWVKVLTRDERERSHLDPLFSLSSIYIVKYTHTYTHIYLCMSLYNICVCVPCVDVYKLNIIIIVCVYIERGDLIMSYCMMNDDDYYASCCLLFYVCVCLYCIICVFDGLEFAFEIYMWVFSMMMLLLLLFCCCVFQLI